MTAPRLPRSDEGAIVLGWLTKLTLVLALFALVAFDGVNVVTATFATSDQAGTAASAAADAFKSSHSVQTSYDAALAAVSGTGDTVDTKTFRIDADGHVSLVVHRTATTIWLHRVGPLAHFADVKATGTGSPG